MQDPRLLAHCQARCGTVVGDRWRLDGLLGIGGMAAVYVGTHTIGRREAIKVLHPSLAGSPDVVARFEREARAVNAFHHPGAVDIRDLGRTTDGCPFLVMELLEGETLGQRVHRLDGLPREELLRFADELLDVLGAAHASGIVHRDLKLENLFVTREGRLKVLDFGIAHVAGQRRITQLGDVIGTLSYMAPEQAAGEGIDARTDLFSVGVILFRVLAGRRIHAAQSEESLVLAMGTTQAPPLLSVAPSVEPALAAVIDRALRFRKEERFQSAAEMRAALRTCWPTGAPLPLPAVTPPPRSPARTLWLVGAALFAIVIGGATFLYATRSGQSHHPDDGGFEDDSEDDSSDPKPKKKKRKKVAASTSNTASAPTAPPTPQPAPVDPATVELASAVPVGRAAVEAKFGKSDALTRLSFNEYNVLVGTVVADEPTHVDELVGLLSANPITFRDFHHSTRDPAKVEDGTFTLDELPLAALTAMVRDATARNQEKGSKLAVLTCMRMLDLQFTAQHKVVHLAPLRCSVVTDSKYGGKVFNYRPDGTFYDPSQPTGPRPNGPGGRVWGL